MTDEELAGLVEELERRGLAVTKKQEKSWLKAKLEEQGTQRGLLLLVPLLLERVFQLDSSTSIQIVEGMLAIYGTHNVVTPG